MKKTLAMIIAVVMLLSLASACGSTAAPAATASAPAAADSAPSAAAPAAEAAPAATEAAPSRDSVNLAIQSAFQSTDAHGNRAVSELTWREQIYEPLYHMNELTLEYEPRLATDYTISDDGLVYTFTLRQNVKFHNGETMKASDVVFSYDHIKGEKTWSTFYSNIDYAEAIDDYTVAVHFLSKSAAAMNNVSQIWIESEKEVAEQGDAFGTKVCHAGTGPYYIEEFNPETNVVLKAFPDYYRGEAAIKTVNYKYIAEATTGALALEAGELDYYTVPIATFASYEQNAQFSAAPVAANHITYVCINYDSNEALNNDLVRQAIGYAIDKDAINVAAYGGYAFNADYMENPDYNVGAPKGDIVYNYDPEKAMSLLAEAGYPDGVNVGKILTTASGYFADVAIVVQANLEAVGIHAELDVMENAACIANLRAQDYDIGILGYTSTGDYDSFRQRVHSDSVGAYFVKYEGTKFDYKHFDELFAEQLSELDSAKRLEITKELNDAVMATATQFPLFYKSNTFVWDKDLNPVNVPNFPDIYDWSWN